MAIAQFIVLFFSLFSLPLGFARLNRGRGYDYGRNTNLKHHHKRDLVTQSSIVGSLPLIDNQPQLRLELRQLEAEEELWTLYILALSWMQYTPQDYPFSWFQITGIHGAPGQTWGNVDAIPGNDGIGYCHHVSILFPTWHRPYVALYEQTMYNIVQFIASLYPPQDLERYQSAAKRFRIPYWDWAIVPPAGQSVLPLSAGGSSNINVAGPNGIQNISNPLFSFTFNPFNGSIFADFPYNSWNETKRAPYPISSANAISNNSFVAAALDNHLPIFQQRLYNILANYGNYSTFSNEGWIGPNNNGTYDSLESIHDTVHTIGGGGWGHFAIIAYSAFDPLFFLHHANVDRIFSMWQLLYNDTYVVPTHANYSTHTQNQGMIEDVDTPLTPFFYNSTAFWTSDMVRDHTVFGYTYQDVANQTQADVVSTINHLYTDYSLATSSFGQEWQVSKRGRSVEDEFASVENRAGPLKVRSVAWQHQGASDLPSNAIFQGDTYREWVANIIVKKHALGKSYLVYLFLGAVPDESNLWLQSDHLVGSLGVFADNTRMEDLGRVTGTVPLTSALTKMVVDGNVSSLAAEDIEPFLKSQLQMRVAMVNGTVMDPDEVNGLSVSIVSSQITKPNSESELAKWGETQYHFDLFTRANTS
ncbi:Di-copper centre-containing protein [Xylariaceae sp. FL0255]|nr:Di-copper centre-containing protein [Xylariaceae sp. FL0255]